MNTRVSNRAQDDFNAAMLLCKLGRGVSAWCLGEKELLRGPVQERRTPASISEALRVTGSEFSRLSGTVLDGLVQIFFNFSQVRCDPQNMMAGGL